MVNNLGAWHIGTCYLFLSLYYSKFCSENRYSFCKSCDYLGANHNPYPNHNLTPNPIPFPVDRKSMDRWWTSWALISFIWYYHLYHVETHSSHFLANDEQFSSLLWGVHTDCPIRSQLHLLGCWRRHPRCWNLCQGLKWTFALSGNTALLRL